MAALVEGSSVKGAAEAAGVTPGTAFVWLRQEGVKAELRARSGAVMIGAQARLGMLLDDALDAVADGLAGERVSMGRRWAAGTVLRHAVRILELLRLDERVTVLEQQRTAPGGTP